MMKYLSRSEEMVLLAVWRLRGNAYGVTIREMLKILTGQTWAFGALFVTLDRLSKKGFLDSDLSDPTPERGGRSKRMYRLTPHALDALKEVRNLQDNLWSEMPDLSPDNLV